MSRLFGRAANLFNGVRNLFGGKAAPPQSESHLFSGQPTLTPAPQSPPVPSKLPQFAVGTTQPMYDRQGNKLNPEQQIGSMQVFTFSSLWNTSTHTYSWRWDEAYSRCYQDAIAMRRDCFLMGLLFERKYPVAQMPWHVEPDDKKNPRQVAVADYLKACIDTLPNVSDMLMTQLEDKWYGRSANELHWVKKSVKGLESWCTEQTTNINGDKVQFEWDGTPQIRLYPGVPVDQVSEKVRNTVTGEVLEKRVIEQQIYDQYPHIQPEDVAWTDLGMMLRLARPFWRDRYIISKHDCLDADFYESERAGGIHGVGIRHWIYWYWWIRQEVGSYLLDFMERTGLGFTVYYYDPGNPQDFQNVKNIATQQGRNTWIVWPRAPGDTGAQKGVERIEPNTGGAQHLKDMMKIYDEPIERFIVGQTMSGGADNESGLGGSGRAKFARQTKTFIIRNDCLRLQGYLSTDFVRVLTRMNRHNCEQIYGGPLDFECRWVFDIEVDDPQAKLEAGVQLAGLGVTLKADELRSVGGYSKPQADDEVVGGMAGAMAAGGVGQPGAGPPGQPPQSTKSLFQGAANGKPNPPQSGVGGDSPMENEQPKKPIRYAKADSMKLNLHVYQDGEERASVPLVDHAEWDGFADWMVKSGGDLERFAREGTSDPYRPKESLAAIRDGLDGVPEQYASIAGKLRETIADHADAEGILVSAEDGDE